MIRPAGARPFDAPRGPAVGESPPPAPRGPACLQAARPRAFPPADSSEAARPNESRRGLKTPLKPRAPGPGPRSDRARARRRRGAGLRPGHGGAAAGGRRLRRGGGGGGGADGGPRCPGGGAGEAFGDAERRGGRLRPVAMPVRIMQRMRCWRRASRGTQPGSSNVLHYVCACVHARMHAYV